MNKHIEWIVYGIAKTINCDNTIIKSSRVFKGEYDHLIGAIGNQISVMQTKLDNKPNGGNKYTITWGENGQPKNLVIELKEEVTQPSILESLANLPNGKTTKPTGKHKAMQGSYK